jgi:hypothetical protein
MCFRVWCHEICLLFCLKKLGSPIGAEAGAADYSQSSSVVLTPAEEENKRKQEEQWRTDLMRVCHTLLKTACKCLC